MPHKDGWQLLHELKADATTRDIPILVLSIVDNKALGYRLGAFDYLLKPFDREAILAALARIPPRRAVSWWSTMTCRWSTWCASSSKASPMK